MNEDVGQQSATKLIPEASTAEISEDQGYKERPKSTRVKAVDDEDADEARTKEEKKQSFKFIMRYAKMECCWFVIGIFFLLAGSGSDLVVPYYIGLVIDALNKENYDVIGKYCLELFVIVAVSTHSLSLITLPRLPRSPSVSVP